MDIDSMTSGRWIGEIPSARLQPGTTTAHRIPALPAPLLAQPPVWQAAQLKEHTIGEGESRVGGGKGPFFFSLSFLDQIRFSVFFFNLVSLFCLFFCYKAHIGI